MLSDSTLSSAGTDDTGSPLTRASGNDSLRESPPVIATGANISTQSAIRPSPGSRARAIVRARLLRTLSAVLVRALPRVPAPLRPSGAGCSTHCRPRCAPHCTATVSHPAPALLEGPPVRQVRLPLGVRGWMVTGYDEARSVLADARTFSNDFGHLVGRPGIGRELDPGGLGLSDPPYHTGLRRLLAPEFGARRLASRLPSVQAIVDEQLDALEREADDDGRVDLVTHFARPVPWRVICDLLGIREDDRALLADLSAGRFDLDGGVVGPLAAVGGWNEHLRDLVGPGPGRPAAGTPRPAGVGGRRPARRRPARRSGGRPGDGWAGDHGQHARAGRARVDRGACGRRRAARPVSACSSARRRTASPAQRRTGGLPAFRPHRHDRR